MSRRKIDETSRKATPSGLSILKRVRTDGAPVEKIISETDEQVRRLCERQTDTDVSLESVREKFKKFTQPAVYKPSLTEVEGKKSLGAYSQHELEEAEAQELRDCGLNDEEITLWHSQQHENPVFSSSALINPEILDLRLKDIERRIREHSKELQADRGFSTAQAMSRHKLELEKALNQGREEQQKLSALVMKTRDSSASDSPESQLKQIAIDLDNRRPAIPDYGNPFPNPWTLVAPKLPANPEFVGPKEKDKDLEVSDDTIYSNRITIEEIKQLPKFANYESGSPCKVLYIKNLAAGVKQDHLIHLFGRFRVPGDEPITCNLMRGRMSGQAFVSCADIETASRCLHTLCGYKLKGRPMIISYRRTTEDKDVKDVST